MSTQLFFFKLIFKPTIRWAAHQALVGRNRAPYEPEKGRFVEAEVDRLLDQNWRDFDELVLDVSREPTLGSRMNVRLAALTLAMLRSLTAAGIERKYAGDSGNRVNSLRNLHTSIKYPLRWSARIPSSRPT